MYETWEGHGFSRATTYIPNLLFRFVILITFVILSEGERPRRRIPTPLAQPSR